MGVVATPHDCVICVCRQLHPPIIVLEDVYECKDLEQLLVAASALSRRPYIIAALSSGTTKGIPLHQLLFHHQIRSVSLSVSVHCRMVDVFMMCIHVFVG